MLMQLVESKEKSTLNQMNGKCMERRIKIRKVFLSYTRKLLSMVKPSYH